ncbi:MAG: RAMP superfamily CRISPR-associated protein [Gammaproteobacteria bacterium]
MTPLHVGSGDETTREKLTREDIGECVRVDAVAVDDGGCPCLPGPTLKGALRAYLVANGKGTAADSLFGTADKAGKAEIQFAYCTTPQPADPTFPPYWQHERGAGVETSVSLDRHTRTAIEDRLFHREVVPPGTVFRFEATADGLNEGEIADLLEALEGLNHLALGADKASGKGRFKWQRGSVKRFGKDEFDRWWQALATDERADWWAYAETYSVPNATPVAPKHPALKIVIQFDHRFLVNDPDQEPPRGSPEPDMNPLRDWNGRAFLPAKSFRGALRTQAERILRTMGKQACAVGSKRPQEGQCRTLHTHEEVGRLCYACQVFGTPGWRSRLWVSDFTATQAFDEASQQFVAVDRFTGGAREGALYEIRAADKPALSGELRVDARRMPFWGYGLLALAIRDLVEGDIRFGYGRARGYGAARGRLVGGLSDWRRVYAALLPAIRAGGDRADLPQQESPDQASEDDLKSAIRTAVQALRDLPPCPGSYQASEGTVHDE